MTASDIKRRRLELELTLDEMAFALNVTEEELRAIEAGESSLHTTRRFQESFDILEERICTRKQRNHKKTKLKNF